MKKLIFAIALAATQFMGQAQVKTPQSSPKTTITQSVGLTDIELSYSRPSARGRVVFGNLVPFEKLWRTGANENTTISFSTDVTIDGKVLKKGKYAIFTIPKIQSWDVIFYTATDNWGTPRELKPENIALQTTVKEIALSKPVETFTMGFSTITNDNALLEISWENSFVAVKFDVPTQKLAMESIEKALAGPTNNDYFAAAQYYYQANADMSKAKTYIDAALNQEQKPFYYLRLKSLIQAKLGDKKGAIDTAKVSLQAAEAAGNQDYVKMNKDSITEWSK